MVCVFTNYISLKRHPINSLHQPSGFPSACPAALLPCPCFLNKPRSHTHPRSRDSVAMPPTIRAIGSAPVTFMKQRNSRGGVYVASHLRRLAPRTPHLPCFLSPLTTSQPLLVLSPKSEHPPIIIAHKPFWRFTNKNLLRGLCLHKPHPPRVLCPHKPHLITLVGEFPNKDYTKTSIH